MEYSGRCYGFASWPALYYKANYRALQVVKTRRDPLNVFHHAQSIVAATRPRRCAVQLPKRRKPVRAAITSATAPPR
jgi:Berberine and berberine like